MMKAGPADAPDPLRFLEVGADRRAIAVRFRPGALPCIVWLGGFRSDMGGTKAVALDAYGADTGRAVLRFDYSAHGASPGDPMEGTIGRWLEESLAVIEAFAGEAPVLVGSSMGGWIALLVARALRERGRALSGLVLIAPAADFTEALIYARLGADQRRAIAEEGVWYRPSAYGDPPYPITRALIEDGRRHVLLGAPISVGAPVRVLQGMADPDVPWEHTMATVTVMADDDVVLTLIKDGDHRLSRPQDIALLCETVGRLG